MAFAAFGSAPATEHKGPTKTGGIVLALLMPGLIYLGLFFFTPLFSLIITSLEAPAETGGIGEYVYAFDVSSYAAVATHYLPQILRSFYYATVATIIALLISYPLAYFIGIRLRNSPLLKSLMLTLVIAPFFISFLLRTIAWKQMFSDSGFIAQTLYQLELLKPSEHVLGTDFSVIFGLTYNFIPFMTLPLFTTLDRFDTRLLEASQDLYANPFKTFMNVTLPITTPGIISGTLLVFIPISGDYVNAKSEFLGSAKTSMIGNMVEKDFLQNLAYPAASALSVLLMAVIVILVATYVRSAGTEDLL